ncbi:ligase-associated DNA damage response endonuclease PdeM [Caenispirillum bisanense]|uniref:Putative phosphoesterase n=1 Tax=Caenispirillum bisanense TaxID=414052 RepID=A0A286GQC8_9PROT|nr:ligase-associated DNA damage response endonuclease PdeM [Caenispirillum bisanense]SOD97184.1 putative phosphoesterase [Caenispirillum bisanense]
MLVKGVMLLPDPTGALFWPKERTLVVADMHLEKAATLARRGAGLLPPYDTRETLGLLELLVRRHAPKRLIALGDAFHDGEAAQRLGETDAARLRKLTAATDWVWITGNHDPVAPLHLGGRAAAEERIGPLVFRHDPTPGPRADGEVAGHLHPKAAVTVRGQRLSRPCFVTDTRRLLLPAFGTFTGGLEVWDPAIRSLFARDFTVFLTGRDKVHSVHAGRLDRPAKVDARPPQA